MTSLVLVADQGPVRLLTMNRPDARNALSRDLIRALYTALSEADDDEAVRAVVLTGTDPAFCAGVDLKEAAATARGTSPSSARRAASPGSPRCAHRSSGRSTAPSSPAASRWRWAVTS